MMQILIISKKLLNYAILRRVRILVIRHIAAESESFI